MAEQNRRVLLRGVVFKENDKWVARCLVPVDHAVQADLPQTAVRLCVECVLSDIEYAVEHGSFDQLKPPPASEYIPLWLGAEGEGHRYRAREVEFSLPPETPGGERRSVRGLAEFERAHAVAV